MGGSAPKQTRLTMQGGRVLQTFVRIFDWLAEKAEKLRQLVGHVECQVVYLRGFWPCAAKRVQLLFACHAKTRIVWLAVVRPGCRAKHSTDRRCRLQCCHRSPADTKCRLPLGVHRVRYIAIALYFQSRAYRQLYGLLFAGYVHCTPVTSLACFCMLLRAVQRAYVLGIAGAPERPQQINCRDHPCEPEFP
jgi:hypothetical protein